MRPQTLLVVVLALAFGGIAAVGALVFSSGNQGEGPAMSMILVAAAEVARGESIAAEAVVLRKYPTELLPAGALTKVEDAVGRCLLVPIVKDEPILEGKLAMKGAGRGLAPLITKGMRAITIATPNVATGVAGFIVPGSRVDVLWTPPDVGREDRTNVGDVPLLENVEVLAVDEKIDAPVTSRTDSGQMKSVTVQVKPEDAAKLTPALSKGTVHLSLRNPGDDGRAPPRTVPLPPRRSAPVAPVVTTRTMRTFRGTREGVIHLQISDAATNTN